MNATQEKLYLQQVSTCLKDALTTGELSDELLHVLEMTNGEVSEATTDEVRAIIEGWRMRLAWDARRMSRR